MAKQKKTLTTTLIVLLLFVIAVQFIPKAERNDSARGAKAITKQYDVPEKVQSILQKACFDCHSNRTEYPWYSNIQPFAKFMEGHILRGKDELNFDEFGSYAIKKQYNKLRSLENQLENEAMPLRSYTLIHHNARLSNEEISLLTNWSKALRNKMDIKL
ncbi:heme-binding domain-containing protein [Olivibacter domesticus]|uniref:Haem-binding domain-containing protein n=1 Tax=Olivibacter domesticus TaxID=407022 RepID=A0A1H7MV12_OLID1|nr:heme-binding domain-containing protein [Olivibacter domesticus]SEL15196.1 Haem-binding domain-containing protein [Olivibacter domesticus]